MESYIYTLYKKVGLIFTNFLKALFDLLYTRMNNMVELSFNKFQQALFDNLSFSWPIGFSYRI